MWLLDKFFGSGNAVDFSLVATDMHSHLIPCLDDGSQSIGESIQLLSAMQCLGYKKIITTPHIFAGYYNNNNEKILDGLEELKKAAEENDITLELEAAAEYMFDDAFKEKYTKGELLTFGDKYVLIELPAHIPPNGFYEVLFDMRLNGFKPILAHPERYFYWHINFEHYAKLKDSGIYFQVNLPSLTGYYSPEVRKIAEQLIDNNVVEFVGSDLHNQKYFELLKKSSLSKHFEMLVNSGRLLNSSI